MNQFLRALRILNQHDIEYMVIGGFAAVAHGAPITTWDLDVVYSIAPENVERLLPVLQEFGAHYRFRPELKPNLSHMLSRGHKLLKTSLGPMDFLGTAGENQTYEDLVPHSTEVELEPGLTVRLLNLETIISFKAALNADKDRAVLPILRATLAELRRRKPEQ